MRRRATLLLILIPLVFASWLLIKKMPRRSVWPKFDAESKYVYWDVADQHSLTAITKVDVATGLLTHGTLADVSLYNLDTTGNIVRFEGRGPGPPASNEPPVAIFIDPKTGARRTQTLPLEIDASLRSGKLQLVGGRYAVTTGLDRLLSFDLHDPKAQLQTLSTTVVEGPGFLNSTSSDFSCYGRSVPLGPITTVAIFRVDEDGIRQVASIAAESATLIDDKLATLNPSTQRVEIRELGDYSLVESVNIDEHFCASYNLDSIVGCWVIGSPKEAGQTAYYDVLRKKTILSPEPTWDVWQCSSDYRFWLMREPTKRNEWLVYDCEQERICLKCSLRRRVARFLQDNKFAIVHRSMGVFVAVHDLETGATVRHMPYLWCAILQPIVLVGWFGWVAAWVMAIASSFRWIALSIAALAGVVVLIGVSDVTFLTFRPLSSGPSFTAVIYFGLFLGAIVCSGVLAAIAQSHLQLLWPLGLFAAMAWGQCQQMNTVTSNLFTHERTHSRLILLTAFVALLAIVASWILCKCGVRLANPAQPQSALPKRLNLRDYFIWIAAFAIALAASKPLWPPLDAWGWASVDRFWFPLYCVSALLCAMVAYATLLPKGVWFGTLVTLLAWLFMVCSELASFLGDLVPKLPIMREAAPINAIACAAAFSIAITLRLRGWQVGKTVCTSPLQTTGGAG